MIGRLVEQQHIGLAKQYLGQFDTHAPTTRELAGRPVEIAAQKSKTHQRALQLCLIILCPHHHVALVLLRKPLYQRQIVIALVVGARCQLGIHAV